MDLEAPTAAPRGFLGVGISSCLALSQATGLQSLVPLAALSRVRNGDGPDLGLPGGRQTPKAPVMVLVVHAGIPVHLGGEAMWGGLQRPVGIL